jgi:hypothetical protein
MNCNNSELRMVEELLQAIDRGQYGIYRITLTTEELEKYTGCLLQSKLATIAENSDGSDTLKLTPVGKALAGLVQMIQGLEKQEPDKDESEYISAETLQRSRAETEQCRNRLMNTYVIEQAEVIRLETQLKYDRDEEAVQELEERRFRLGKLKGLINTMQRMIDNNFNIRFSDLSEY